MNRQMVGSLIGSICLLLLLGCSNDSAEESAAEKQEDNEASTEILISAAASLTDVMDDVKEMYEETHPAIDLTFNFAGSGTLAQQIQKGAPVDVFISANENWMQTMIDEAYIDKADRSEVTGNRLVLIAAKDSELSMKSFSEIDDDDIDQLAIGNPESVPAGEYTEAALKNLDKWEELESSFVYAKDVRQVLTYVETGNAEIGFVYESDALSSDKVDIIAYSEPGDHEPIIYPGAVLKDSEKQEEGEAFLDFLKSDKGQEVLEDYGFTYKG